MPEVTAEPETVEPTRWAEVKVVPVRGRLYQLALPQ